MDTHQVNQLTLEFARLSPLARELNEEDIEQLAIILKLRALDDGQVLLREGEMDNALHVLVQGKLAVEKNAEGEEPVTLHVLESGDLAGELAFVDGNEHTATLRAVGQSTVLTLVRDDLETLLESHPQLVYNVMRSIVRSGHAIIRRMNAKYTELSRYLSGS